MSAMLNDRATAKKKAGQAAGPAMREASYFLGASLSFDSSLLASAGAGAAAASLGASFAASAAGAAGVAAVSAGFAASLLGAGVAGAGVAGAAAGAGVTGAAGGVVDEADLLSLQAVTASASDAAKRSVLFIVEIPSMRLGGASRADGAGHVLPAARRTTRHSNRSPPLAPPLRVRARCRQGPARPWPRFPRTAAPAAAPRAACRPQRRRVDGRYGSDARSAARPRSAAGPSRRAPPRRSCTPSC